ncbi:type II secretion system secretin GspD [Inhella sp.]|uniref:type II secretion system secretin GspD n=1 Tax=Inhella sp. TaxID=1921806 RepID=UPI0035B1327D
MKLQAIALSTLLAMTPLLAQPPALKANTPVSLNFVNADLEAVTRAMANMIGQPILVDPRVKGVVTLYSEQPLKVSEAYAQYLSALRGLGFSVVNAAGLLKVVPEADAKLQATGVIVGEDSKARGDQVLTQVFQLRHENANNLVAVLRPLVNVNNTINANPGNNSLVITDYADNLQRISKIIAALDTPASTDVEIVPLKHQVASELAPLVQRLDGGGAGGLPGVQVQLPGMSGSTVLADPRGNALILRAPNAARLASLKKLVLQLDVPVADGGAANIRVVHLKNADAVKLSQVLRAAFAAQAANSTAGASSSGLGGASFGVAQTLPGVGSSMPSSQQVQGSSSATGGGAQSAAATGPLAQSQQPVTGGNVQADPSTNSLIITAPEPLYRQMRAVIDQLDTRRAQVYVEAIIVKVDASKGAQFGIQWQNLFGQKGDKTLSGLGTNFGTGNSNILNLSAAATQGIQGAAEALAGGAPAGLNLGFLKKVGNFYTLGAIANFLETQTGANILSTPNLVALDNEEARIVVGQNVPFVTGSFAQGSSGANVNPFTTVERKDVGLVLRVTSQIGEGGAVRMKIVQENSSLVPGSNSTTGPITDKSEIQTSVTVDDGGLLVLGGLMRDEYTDGDDGVPGLSKIPLLGNLFKSANRSRKKSNLMVFLRPIVLRDADDLARFTLDRYEQIRATQQAAQPEPSALMPNTGAPVLPERGASAPR